jgi:heterotetrameric sarcosine oxidase gamma subunit
VSLGFLSPAGGATARSPMERQALAAGAELRRRDGWNVAARFDGADAERERCRSTVGFADLSHLGKVEVQAEPGALEAIAARTGGAWWCRYTAGRALALCEPGDLPALRERLADAAADEDGLTSVVDVSAVFAALAVEGPLARELFARFTALDLRDSATPVHVFRPGSVARTPGAVLRQAEDRWLMLFGAALGQYMWTVVADAAEALGGGPVGIDTLEPVEPAVLEAMPRA